MGLCIVVILHQLTQLALLMPFPSKSISSDVSEYPDQSSNRFILSHAAQEHGYGRKDNQHFI
jgi:hypothetical protein